MSEISLAERNSGTLSKLANILHTLSCEKEHSFNNLELANRKPGVCYYYVEESTVCDQIDHEWWEKEAEHLCTDYDLQPSEMLRIIPKLLEIRSELSHLLEKYPRITELAHLLLFA